LALKSFRSSPIVAQWQRANAPSENGQMGTKLLKFHVTVLSVVLGLSKGMP
jgi:hypothetical protein